MPVPKPSHRRPRTLITGANRGLGLELVKQYAEDGWDVLAACRDPEGAHELTGLAEGGVGSGEDGSVQVHALSVTDWSRITELADELRGTPLDMLINNAGVMPDEAKVLGEIDPGAFLHAMEVNALGALKVAEAFRPHLAEGSHGPDRAGGLLVMMSSAMGSIARIDQGGDYGYRSSKAAMNALTRSLAADLKESRITVVALHPGWVRTDMGGSHARLSVEESVSMMRDVLADVDIHATGRFFRFDGREQPW